MVSDGRTGARDTGFGIREHIQGTGSAVTSDESTARAPRPVSRHAVLLPLRLGLLDPRLDEIIKLTATLPFFACFYVCFCIFNERFPFLFPSGQVCVPSTARVVATLPLVASVAGNHVVSAAVLPTNSFGDEMI